MVEWFAAVCEVDMCKWRECVRFVSFESQAVTIREKSQQIRRGGKGIEPVCIGQYAQHAKYAEYAICAMHIAYLNIAHIAWEA